MHALSIALSDNVLTASFKLLKTEYFVEYKSGSYERNQITTILPFILVIYGNL